jgi:hypothetical protein
MSTQSEIRTFAELSRELVPLGYSISQNYRVIDAIRAAAPNPEATRPLGPSVADVFLPAIRESRGPLGPAHPWLRPGDWDYAFKSSFDFVVLAPLGERWPTLPLFAVEFDGPYHVRPEVQARDLRKNRLCVASGLPLLRIDGRFHDKRDRLSLLAWLAQLWAARRQEMPKLMAQRDDQIAWIHDEADAWVQEELFDDPSLDVEFIFRLMHPFPPTETLLVHLARRHGLQWGYQQSHFSPEAKEHVAALFARQAPRWRVSGWRPMMPVGEGQPWHLTVALEKVGGGETVDITGIFESRTHYPLDREEKRPADWIDFFCGDVPILFAGPWPGASSVIGEALCIYNTVREIGEWLRRNDRT